MPRIPVNIPQHQDAKQMNTNKHPLGSRIALFFLIIGAIVWLGTTNTRAIIGNELLKIGTLEFEEYLPPETEAEIFRLLSITSLVVMISYAVTLLSAIFYLVTTPLRLKEHGWLMMSAILFFAFVPVELFTSYLDLQLIRLEFFTTANRDAFRELFIARIGALAGAPTIAFVCYITIIGLAVFRPFVRPERPAV